MLDDRDVAATVAVRDAEAARRFYGGALGLTALEDDAESGVTVYRCGASTLVVYLSDTGGRNPATSATWGVGDDFEAVIDGLLAKGVTLQRYPGMEADARGVVRFGDFRAAWFKDPDGNTLHVNSG